MSTFREIKLSSLARLADNEASMKEPVVYEGHEPCDPPRNDDYFAKSSIEATRKTTNATLDRSFDSFRCSSERDRAFVSAYFSGKDYESHSPLLRKYAQAGHIPSDESLRPRAKTYRPWTADWPKSSKADCASRRLFTLCRFKTA